MDSLVVGAAAGGTGTEDPGAWGLDSTDFPLSSREGKTANSRCCL